MEKANLEGELNKAMDEQIFSCRICFELFSSEGDHIPRVLNCLHSYCHKCLCDVVATSGEMRSILCPTCRKVTELPTGSTVEILHRNFTVLNVMEIMKRHEVKPIIASGELVVDEIDETVWKASADDFQNYDCAICALSFSKSECGGGCNDCKGLICNSCIDIHQRGGKLFQGHNLLSTCDFINQQLSLAANPSPIKCKKHPVRDIEFCCLSCRVTACPTCGLLEHSCHKLVLLHDGAIRERERIARARRIVVASVPTIEANVEEATKALQDFEDEQQSILETIELESNKLKLLIDQRTSQVRAEVVEKAEGPLKILRANKYSLENKLARAHSCIDFVERAVQHGSDVDIYEASDKMMHAMASLSVSSHWVDDMGSQERVMGGATGTQVIPATKAGGDHTTDNSAAFRSAVPTAGPEALAHIVDSRRSVYGLSLLSEDSMARAVSAVASLFHVEVTERVEALGPWPLTRGTGIIGSGKGCAPGQLNDPCGMALYACAPSSGMPSVLFVTDHSNHYVQLFDANTGAYIRSIGYGYGSDAGQLKFPCEGALRFKSPLGSRSPSHFYLADWGNHRIQVFDPNTGDYLQTIGEGMGRAPGQFKGPSRVAVRTLDGHESHGSHTSLLYVTDAGNNRIQVFDADTGSHIRCIGDGPGSEIGQLNSPSGIALHAAAPGSDSPTRLYVADFHNNRVQVFDADSGSHIRYIGTGPGSETGQLKSPRAVAVYAGRNADAAPHLYVADAGNHHVQVYDAITGAHLRCIGGGRGSAQGLLNGPWAVTAHPGPDGATLLFVSDQNNHRVQVFVDA